MEYTMQKCLPILKIKFNRVSPTFVNDGYAVLFLDESIFPIAPYLTYGWFPVGSHPTVKYEYERKERHCVFGALNAKHFIYEFAETLNGDVFKRFVKRLICIFKKLVIVIDQGPYHTSHEKQKFYEYNKEHLHVVHFPAYSPELDHIEQSWRAAKKWLAIRYWENKSQMKEQLIAAFEQDIIRAPIYDYLST